MCDGLAHQLLPDALEVVLLADRGFASRDLMKYLKDKLGWHYRIRIKRHFYFQYRGVWQSVKSVKLNAGQARFVESVRLGKTKPKGTVHARVGSQPSQWRKWAIVTDEVHSCASVSTIRLAVSSRGEFFGSQIKRL